MPKTTITRLLCSQLNDGFVQLNQMLDRLGFSDNPLEFRIFVDPRSAVEYFRFPKKATYKGIQLELVGAFPSRMCVIMRSNEFLPEE